MKVLFIGHYKEQSGWGRAACEYILALDEAGVDVVCRPVIMNQTYSDIPKRVLELEKKSTEGCDICIQCVLPHLLSYNGNFDRNICIPFIDTRNLKTHPWIPNMELFEVWSPYKTLASELAIVRNDDVPEVVPVPCDPSKYLSSIQPLDIGIDLGGSYKFYSIFDLNNRKNIVSLLQAFHLEFKPYEDVQLIIKTSKHGQNEAQVTERVLQLNNQVCEGLKLYKTPKYKTPIVLAKNLTDQEIEQLHVYGDCFVLPTHGEAWCFPAFDAMGFCKSPIVTKGTSCDEYILEDYVECGSFIEDGTGYLVDSSEVPVVGMTDTFDEIFTARETWLQPDMSQLRYFMRRAYDNRRNPLVSHASVVDMVNNFSREIIGTRMKEILCTPR